MRRTDSGASAELQPKACRVVCGHSRSAWHPARAAVNVVLLTAVVITIGCAPAPRMSMFATVYAHHTYTVGARNPAIGLFAFQGDSVWTSLSAPNCKAWSLASTTQNGSTVLHLAAGNGLHRSTDGGAHWRLLTDWRITDVLCVQISPLDAQTIHIGTACGLWRTHDGGSSWEPATGLGAMSYVSALHPVTRTSTEWLAASATGILRSTDDGRTWMHSGCDGMAVKCILADPEHPLHLLVGAGEHGIFRSTDGGANWEHLLASKDLTVYSLHRMQGEHGSTMLFAGCQDRGVLRSEDEGMHWSASGLDGMTVHALASANGHLFAATIGNGVQVSANGGATWRSAGLAGARVWSVAALEVHP